jgi:hypothetical protein
MNFDKNDNTKTKLLPEPILGLITALDPSYLAGETKKETKIQMYRLHTYIQTYNDTWVQSTSHQQLPPIVTSFHVRRNFGANAPQ